MNDGSSNRDSTPPRRHSGAHLRQHVRVDINEEFKAIEQYIAEYVTNISQGGVFIRSKNPLPVGTRVHLKFTVILDDLAIVEGEGEVVRREVGEGMGVAFTRLSAKSKSIIDEIVDRAVDAKRGAHGHQ
ncbi:MAG: PilZ domain-containing protein [Myxococcota bacterium]